MLAREPSARSARIWRFAKRQIEPFSMHCTPYLKRWCGRLDRNGVVAFSRDQHTDHKQIENVGADADGERGRMISL